MSWTASWYECLAQACKLTSDLHDVMLMSICGPGDGPCAAQVDYYGAPTPLRQLGNVSAPEASLLVVNVYDKGAMQASCECECACLESDRTQD